MLLHCKYAGLTCELCIETLPVSKLLWSFIYLPACKNDVKLVVKALFCIRKKKISLVHNRPKFQIIVTYATLLSALDFYFT